MSLAYFFTFYYATTKFVYEINLFPFQNFFMFKKSNTITFGKISSKYQHFLSFMCKICKILKKWSKFFDCIIFF